MMSEVPPNLPANRWPRLKAGLKWAGISRTKAYEVASTEEGRGLLVTFDGMTFLDTAVWTRILENAPKAIVRSPSGRDREARAQSP
jgi:hypothetical protein